MESTGKLDAIQVRDKVDQFESKAGLIYCHFQISKYGADILANEGFLVQRRGEKLKSEAV